MDLHLDRLPLRTRMRFLRTWYAELPEGFRVGASTGGEMGARWPVLGAALGFMVALGVTVLGQIRQSQSISVLEVIGALAIVAIWSWWVCTVFGKVELEVEGNVGVIFVGIGGLGWRRRFIVDSVSEILVERSSNIVLPGEHVMLRAEDKYFFGRLLTSRQRNFIVSIVKERLGIK